MGVLEKKFNIDSQISLSAKICLVLSTLIMLSFFIVETCVVFGYCEPSMELSYFGYGCIIGFTPLFTYVVIQFLNKKDNIEKELIKKNTYLEHAAKILRHDMHSGINVYIPRGLSSLERRLTPEQIKSLKIEAPLKMIKEGLNHTQKVYKGVYEFTNLVKQGQSLDKTKCNIGDILNNYLKSTSYKSQVKISNNLPNLYVNESLFCTAIDNLIRNGLKYNDSDSKVIKIYRQGIYICVEDNGRGMTNSEFQELSQAYVRKVDQKEQGSGLGLNICTSILEEHGYTVTAQRLTKGMVDFFKELDEMEKRVSVNTKMNVFNRELLEQKAAENNYRGKLKIRRGGRALRSDEFGRVSGAFKAYVVYEDGNKNSPDSIKGTKIKIKLK